MTPERLSVEALSARIPDGASLAMPRDDSGCAMAAVRCLLERRPRNLHLIGIPTLGFPADMLIGAGCVATLEVAALTLGEFGPAPRFVEAIKTGSIAMRDSTCPAIHAGLQAAEKGLPFMPLRGLLGSDLLKHRPDWQVISNPLADAEDPIVVLPAISPDIVLFHAPRADRHGNVWIGVRRELMLAAHAGKVTLVTVETVDDDADFLADDVMAAGTIPALYISAIAKTANGTWPLGLRGVRTPDNKALKEYVTAARTREGFEHWVAELREGEPA